LSDVLERYRWLIAGLLAVPLLSGVFLLLEDRLSEPAPYVIEADADLPVDIRVYITGAVRNPGVYPLSADARWIDALEVAGGATDDADLTAVNLARRVQDEDQIVVPVLGGRPVVAGASQGPLVNINTADAAALESLPGIGEVRAERILLSRQEDGPFAQVDELLTRDLIPDSVFQDIVPLITVQ